MMKIYNYRMLTLCAFLLTLSHTSAVFAEYKPGPIVDARELNIAGVKIGMRYETALEVLAKTYEVDSDEIKLISLKTDVDGEIKEYPGAIELSSDASSGVGIGLPASGWEISVRFGPTLSFPKNLGVEVVAIEYKMAWTQENVKSLSQSALDKYGEATVDRQAMGFQWCDEPSTHWANCESEAVMDYSGTTLTLTDQRPHRLYRELLDKMKSKKAEI